jgi:hypothetical protein
MKRLPFQLLSGLVVLLSCLTPRGLAQSIKPGTEIKVHLLDRLDTGESKTGQSFSGTLAEAVSLGSKRVLQGGTRINGRVIEATSAGRLKRPASITLILTSINKIPIRTEALQIDGKSHAVRNTALIGGGAAAGAIVGAVAEGGKGAAIGTAVGASAGTGTAYVTGKQEIVLPSETELTFVIAERAAKVARTPDPAVERPIEHAPDPRPIKWRDDSREENDEAYDALIFSDQDKWVISSYFKSNYGNLPPGLASRGEDLPPGLEKHLHRDEPLPPSLEKRAEPLPAELNRQLPRLPFGYSRVVVSGRVMNLADDGQIVDVMFIYR